jgi:hypothetical protein
VTAYDSRGYTDYKTATLNIASYSPPVVISSQSSVARTGYGTNTQAIVSGALSQIIINGSNKNYATTLPMWYRYKLTTGSYTNSWTNITSGDPVTGGLSFAYTNSSLVGDSGSNGFAQGNDYNVQFAIMDRFSYIQFEFTLPKAIPVASILNQKVGVNNPNPSLPGVDLGTGSKFQINGVDIFLLIYPVGCLYMSANSTNPSTLFGGTWVAWGAGRVPIGVGSNGVTNYSSPEATGGAESKVLSQANLPNVSLTAASAGSHSHGGQTGAEQNWNSSWGPAYLTTAATGPNSQATAHDDSDPNVTATHDGFRHYHGISADGAHTHSVSLGGSGSAIDIRPMYETCYIWKRTA